MTDKAISRLRKLLSMTTDRGCTEDEQETALRLAASLAAKHGIELDSLRTEDQPKPKAVLKRRSEEFKMHQGLAARAAAALVGVEAHVYRYGAGGITFVGREELIEMAEELMFFLFRQIEALYKEALPKGLSQRERAEFRRTFKPACAYRTLERAEAHMKKLKQDENTAREATGSTALVVSNYFDTLKNEVDEFWEERLAPSRKRAEAYAERDRQYLASLSENDREKVLKQRAKEEAKAHKKWAKRKGPRGRSLPFGSGTNSGFAAGDRVKLRQEID